MGIGVILGAGRDEVSGLNFMMETCLRRPMLETGPALNDASPQHVAQEARPRLSIRSGPSMQQRLRQRLPDADRLLSDINEAKQT